MTSHSPTVRIAEKSSNANLSKSQKKFNQLIKKIETERKRLELWQNAMHEYQQKYTTDLVPEIQNFNLLRAQLVRLFDNAHTQKTFTKIQKEKLQDIICYVAVQLIDQSEDSELKEIYNRHSDDDFDAQAQQETDSMKSLFESMLDVEMDDDIDLQTPEQIIEHLQKKMQQKQEAPKPQKKSAKTLAKEAKEAAETQHISQSIREVYRKLASALHPDKEQDLNERARKTALMQRVNMTYNNKDLLGLLTLQLEVEQIDQTAIDTLTEDRLKYYNKTLNQQCVELQNEIHSVQFAFGMQFNVQIHSLSTPAMLIHALQWKVEEIKQAAASLKEDLELFTDPKQIKNYLKSHRVAPKMFVNQGGWSR